MIARLLLWLAGVVTVRAPRAGRRRPERLINLGVGQGLIFWDLRRRGEALEWHMRWPDFRRLRPLVRQAGIRPRLVGRRGWPIWRTRARRRRLFLCGGCAVLVALYVSAHLVWFVEVDGAENVPVETILAAAAQLGVRPGAWRGAVSPGVIERELPLAVPQLVWAGLEFRGSKAILRVAEGKGLLHRDGRAPAGDGGEAPGANALQDIPASLVAARSGLVTRVVAEYGTPLVQPGDTVQRGQILIAGVIRGNPVPLPGMDWQEDPTAPSRLVHARGSVMARVWYDRTTEEPLQQSFLVPTGRAQRRWALRVVDRLVPLWGHGPPPFQHYELVRERWGVPRWRNTIWPVEAVALTYREMTPVPRRIGDAEAVRRARDRLRREVLAALPADARIVDMRWREVRRGPQSVRVRLVVETEEEIARPVLLQPPAAPPPGQAPQNGV